MRSQTPLQKLLLWTRRWWRYFISKKGKIRPIVKKTITKILSCGLSIRGRRVYCCSNSECNHTKYVPFGCKSRFCPTCGKKATDNWVNKQMEVLPRCAWQHVTFTMPGCFWPIFENNRDLLNHLPRLAADCLMTLAKKRGLTVGIFTALHTFGHDLKWNTHVHLSVTMGGLDQNNQWKNIRFDQEALMRMWRYRIIQYLRTERNKGTIDVPKKLLAQKMDINWHVHMAEPTMDAKHSVSYLGRYTQRPPVAMSRLLHYDGHNVVFAFKDRKTGKKVTASLNEFEFLDRLLRHIPNENFRMIRYYGFLANRVRNELLPHVYKALEQTPKNVKDILWSQLFQKSFGVNPLECILCGSEMKLTATEFGLSSAQLEKYHYELANALPVRC